LQVPAVAAPVKGFVTVESAKSLRHHRALHRMKTGSHRIAGSERDPVDSSQWYERSGRVAEVPSDSVEVAEDVAARACAVTVPRRSARIVEKAASVADRVRAGVELRGTGNADPLIFLPAGGIDNGNRVFEAVHDVEPAEVLSQRKTARTAADVDRIDAPGCGVDDRDVGGPEAGHVTGRAAARELDV